VPLPPQVLTRKRSFRPLWAISGEGFSSPQRRPTHESIDVLIARQVEDVRDKQPVKRRYVDQVSVSLRPNTVRHIELDLRRFGTWLTNHHPDVACCADLERHHIEAFKTWLSTAPTPGTGKPLNRVSIKNALINLHCFFDRVTEWGYPNAPVRPLVLIGDLPIIDKPLPRFLEDAAAAKLLRTTRQDTDPLARLIVELLARTGIRVGELLALTVDAVVQIGSAFWLRIPVGKLHNDRYIPLHPTTQRTSRRLGQPPSPQRAALRSAAHRTQPPHQPPARRHRTAPARH
jgi:site-specific recombinase XerD